MIPIYLFADLAVPRQRVHEDHRALRMLKHVIVDDEATLQTLVLVQTREALLLDTCTVQDVGASDDVRGELLALDGQVTGFLDLISDF